VCGAYSFVVTFIFGHRASISIGCANGPGAQGNHKQLPMDTGEVWANKQVYGRKAFRAVSVFVRVPLHEVFEMFVDLVFVDHHV
jgi:hypothetical protein